MKKVMSLMAAFISGGIAGFVMADRMMKQKYEQLVQDEVDSIKAAFRKERPLSERERDGKKADEKLRSECHDMAVQLGYTEQPAPSPKQSPKIIPPDEFGNEDGYDEISLTLYADGTVTDDCDRAMSEEEIEETIGKESLSHFGEYEPDSVCVRNDRLKADYEILKDQRAYADVLKEKPYLIQA